ncbi:MAG: hypothetical protein CM15mP58_11280 [Burkholderiaceae bacterium]|nr:MAG: hypothetical protein CM15mP58_11280 [Burkholderiaceae bacterium]
MHLTKDEKSIETHVQDTIRAGDGLVDQEVLEFIARSGYKATEWLINHGVIFSQDKKLNQLHLVLEGGIACLGSLMLETLQGVLS